jgi:Na+/proline symporter
MDSGRLQPALYGGLVIGVLSALPVVNLGNCCCCLWVVGGGVLAVYLRQQNSPFAVNSAEGALTGLLAGLIGGVIAAAISIPLMAMMGPFQERMINTILNSRADIPEESRDMIERMMQRGGFGAVALVLSLVWHVLTGAVFGMLGGLLGVAIFKKDLPPPPPPSGVEVLPPQ